MSEKVNKLMNDSAALRWTALVLIALMMFFAYLFADILSPLKSTLEATRGWDSAIFGTYAGGEYFLNVFCFFLIFAGIILDKMGVRFTGILSASLMVIGAVIKYIGVSEWFQATAMCDWLNSWWTSFPGSAKLATLGFMIFGCGCEMAGTTVSKAIAKWFKGKEMAMAMGVEMSIGRLGVFAAMWLSPAISKAFPDAVGSPVLFGALLLCIGLISFTVFTVMDRKFDAQLDAIGEADTSKADEFEIKDLGKIFSSKMFWIVAILCVLYYSGIFPFQKFAPNYLEVTLGVEPDFAAKLFSVFPILAMVLTPFLGLFLDKKGKGASMLLIGAIIMVVCHLSFAFVLPLYKASWLAVVLILVLGVSFSLVPAALWPSVPKIIDEKILGSAYCLIFWVQNIGLWGVPLLIGNLEKATGGYTVPMIVFASFGVIAFIFAILLKIEDRKKGYGLELPNIKED
ncbi:MAG: MFS transporter [Bacteroidales bacterium]|nr:MFS transporter [Bacteroidales bacterium]MBQ9653379.1 MFS transporter [Bacteroidales bacterium]